MKRETLNHPKLYELMARLGCDKPQALGYLTLLWDFTADHAIQGDIGKWHNGAIARACDWLGDADKFIDGLVNAGWLDADSKHRLLVHDWQDHCERWVKAKLDKLELSFTEPTTDRTAERTTEQKESESDESIDGSPPCDQTKPNQTKPNQFSRFWNLYPKKIAKSACEKKWKAKNLDRLADQICDDVEARVTQDKKWLDGFTPNPLTYLNQERWADEWERSEPKPAVGPKLRWLNER